jgi:hypothetical protein
MNIRRLVATTALVVTVTACAVKKVGSPGPRDPDRPASTTSSGSSVSPLPHRPRELDITGVNPCTDVLTVDQLHQLAYDLGYQRSPITGKSDINGGPTCAYGSMDPPDQPSRKIGSLIGISTSEGADAWLTDPRRETSADLHRMATVAGFPALILPHPRFVDNCAVVVDVHAGQYLQVSSRPAGGADGTSPEPYCTEAQRISGIIVQNLLARR